MSDVLYYLGVEVRIIEPLGGGWVLTEWPDGKRWKQWRDQLTEEPWR